MHVEEVGVGRGADGRGLGVARAAQALTLDGLRTWRNAMVDVQIDRGSRQQVAAGFSRGENGIRAGPRSMHTAGRLVADADPDAPAVAVLAALHAGS